VEFEDSVEAAVETLPDDLRDAMSNVAIVAEDDPPAGQPLLGL
jgi:predicted Zn-dependent protease with MMP-like domain